MGESARCVPAPFLTKTYDMVDDGETEELISWNEDGTRFVVWKTAEFAKDLLPNYFKHNNFSSFVRQLNTYGFRKTVPDKWEFANENFKRGQKELLNQIRRRKIASTQHPPGGKPIVTDNLTSPANSSGEDLGSSSTSSPDSKNPGSLETQTSAQLADLSNDNEKLRKDNQMLSSELSQTKKRCDELIAYLTQCMKVSPEQINRIMNLGAGSGVCDGDCDSDTDTDNDENGNCMKLFGVVVKRKRGHHDDIDFSGSHRKEMKTNGEFNVSLDGDFSATPGEEQEGL